jgi:hypothetical protein
MSQINLTASSQPKASAAHSSSANSVPAPLDHVQPAESHFGLLAPS